MSKNPQERNRVPGENEGAEEMENMPKDVKVRKDEESGQPHKGDQMNRPRDTDENMVDRKRRPA